MENILVGLIGRPILFLIRVLRWWWISGAILIAILNNGIINPIIAIGLGLALTAIGITIKRYDEIYDDYVKPEIKQ